MINRELLDSIIRDIKDDSWEMEKVDKTGQAHGWAARFRAYAEALEGHIPRKNVVSPIGQAMIDVSAKEQPDDDEDFVPIESPETTQ
jgi:hypothetical protein